jgi:feruloyl esterase
VLRPTTDSEIKFALWMPASGWNGKYRQEGNGGWAGTINVGGLIEPLSRGYAVAATDNGHEGGGASWAIGHPEKLIDFGHRAVHETSVQAKAIVRAFYGRGPERSYFNGCSDGGREALMEAQRYPEDFNGIIAGAPASHWSHLFTAFVWNERALLATPGSSIPPAKLPAIQRAVVSSCDAIDGLADSLIEDPRACRFDPGVLACKAGDGADCLTRLRWRRSGRLRRTAEPRTMEQFYPGQPPGTGNCRRLGGVDHSSDPALHHRGLATATTRRRSSKIRSGISGRSTSTATSRSATRRRARS